MERGEIGIEGRPMHVYVFEGLIAHLAHPRAERAAIRLRRWESALDAWEFDYTVCDHMTALVNRYGVPIEVLTWHHAGFAAALLDRLRDLDVPVRDTQSGDYAFFSQRFATDPETTLVYDANPAHRFGYGYKAREFDKGRF